MADEDEEQTEGEEGAEPKKGKSKLMLIIIIVVVLLGGGGGAAFFLMGGSDEEAEEGSDIEEIDITYAHFELKNIIVNLSEHSSFLKSKILVEYDPTTLGEEGAAAVAAEAEGEEVIHPRVITDRTPMMKDSVLAVLSSKNAAELLTAEGKETLKDELVEGLNDALGLEEAPIVAVYFVEFIIQ